MQKRTKLLYILNVAKRVNNFSYTSMLAAKDLGIEFHIAGNWSYESDAERMADEEKYGIRIHQIDFIRTPYHPKNRQAYKQLRRLVESEKYDVIHCNTPIGGVLGRMVGKKCKVPKIIYQAHGFHFYKGAPFLNWLIYYPIEKWLAHHTDALITINNEDYERAGKLRLRKGGKVYYVSGVGIDTDSFSPSDNSRSEKRKELNLKDGDIMVISSGDLVKRKNYDTAIKAVAAADDKRLQFFICGEGPERERLLELARRCGVESQVHILGYRADMKELLLASDIFLFTTLQEGLSRSLMEAMAAGLPCLASNIRGNVDLIANGCGGFLYQPADASGFADGLRRLSDDAELRRTLGKNNAESILKFNVDSVYGEIKQIYKSETNANSSASK